MPAGTEATEWRRRCGNNQSRLKDPIPAGFEENRWLPRAKGGGNGRFSDPVSLG